MTPTEKQLYAEAVKRFQQSSAARELLSYSITWYSNALITLVDKLRPVFAKRNPDKMFTIISFGCGNALEILAIYVLTSGLKNIRYIGIDIGQDSMLPSISSFGAIYANLADPSTRLIFEPLDISNKSAMLKLLEKYQLTKQNIDAVILRHPCMNVVCQEEPYREDRKGKGHLLTGTFPDSPLHPSPFRALMQGILPLMLNEETAIYLSCYRKWEFLKVSEIFSKYAPRINYEHCDSAPGIIDKNPPTDLATGQEFPIERHFVDGYYQVFSPDPQKLKEQQALLQIGPSNPCGFFTKTAIATTIAVSVAIALSASL